MNRALSRFARVAIGITVLALAAGPVAAQTGVVAFTLGSFEGGGTTQNFYTAGSASVDYSAGFKFHAGEHIQVTHLGTLDWNSVAVAASGDGLDVALYTTNGTLLASATVTTSDTLTSVAGVDGRDLSSGSVFRYHPLGSPVNLAPGDYIIISETVRGDVIPKAFGTFGFSNILPTPSMNISWVHQWTQSGVSSAAFYSPPNTDPDPTKGYFGPNFLAIPEPAGAVLVLLGLLPLGLRRNA